MLSKIKKKTHIFSETRLSLRPYIWHENICSLRLSRITQKTTLYININGWSISSSYIFTREQRSWTEYLNWNNWNLWYISETYIFLPELINESGTLPVSLFPLKNLVLKSQIDSFSIIHSSIHGQIPNIQI